MLAKRALMLNKYPWFDNYYPARGGQVNEATTVLAMRRLSDIWDQLFPAERHRLVNLMIERIDLVHDGEIHGFNVKWRELGWDEFIGEFTLGKIGAEQVQMEAQRLVQI